MRILTAVVEITTLAVFHPRQALPFRRAVALQLVNWLQVLGPAERAQIDQRVRHQLHPIVPLLDTFKTEQQPLKFILPGKGPFDTHAQRMDGGIEEVCAHAWWLCDAVDAL